MFNPTGYLRPHILEMRPYTPIMPFEVLSKQLGIPADKIIKLDANENPYGPLPCAVEVLAELPFAHIYPDPESRILRQAIETYTGVPSENILVGAGADELIDLIMRLLLDPDDVVLNCPPTFGMYHFDAQVNAAQVISIPRKPDFELDMEGIISAVEEYQPKVLFLASPNNPDGSLLSESIFNALLDLPLLLVLDEAYIEFSGEKSMCKRVPMRDKFVVLRTFSKWAGLAGMRVGFGVFPDWIMPYLWKIKQPYNVSVAGSRAAIESLNCVDQLKNRIALIVSERKRLYGLLKTIPWLTPYPSRANFILCKATQREAARIKADLAQQGILIRYFNTEGLKDYIRISVGKPEHTDRLLDALRAM